MPRDGTNERLVEIIDAELREAFPFLLVQSKAPIASIAARAAEAVEREYALVRKKRQLRDGTRYTEPLHYIGQCPDCGRSVGHTETCVRRSHPVNV